MTYEEAIEKMQNAANTKTDDVDEYATFAMITAAAEAVGLREIMIKAQNWEDSFKDHGVADFDFDDHLPAALAKHKGQT